MKKLFIKKIGTIGLALAILLTTPFMSFGTVDVLGIEDTGAYLLKKLPSPEYGMVGGDWTALALARSGISLPKSYGNKYLANVEKALKEKNGELSRNKYSEYSRLILGLGATGKDPRNVGGYKILSKLTDLDLIERQGINGPIYALLALDSLGYDSLIREDLISSIIKRELPRGGFSLSGDVADPDVTAAALQVLSKYKTRKEIGTVIEKALNVLSDVQLDTGGFTGWSSSNVENSESIAQVILALTALGIDPMEDQRFIKQNKNGESANLIDALATFRLENGSYRHLKDGDSDIMATEQAMLAMVAYDRFLKGQNHIFRMGDIEGGKYKYKVLLNGEHLNFDVEPINENGRILVPMRAIFENLGATVQWDGELRRVTGELNDTNIMLEIDRPCIMVNELMIKLDVAPTIKNGRTLVPLRVVAESFDMEVGWDGETETATIK